MPAGFAIEGIWIGYWQGILFLAFSAIKSNKEKVVSFQVYQGEYTVFILQRHDQEGFTNYYHNSDQQHVFFMLLAAQEYNNNKQ